MGFPVERLVGFHAPGLVSMASSGIGGFSTSGNDGNFYYSCSVRAGQSLAWGLGITSTTAGKTSRLSLHFW